MRLRDRLGRDGAFLFRWRSYIPLLLLAVAIPAFGESARMEGLLGERISHA